jgi:hypothetical protein
MLFLQNLEAVSGPVTKLGEIAEYIGVDALVRAIDRGLPVYDTVPGGPLMADLAEAEVLAKAATVSGATARGVR